MFVMFINNEMTTKTKYSAEYVQKMGKALPHGGVAQIAKKLNLPWSTVKDALTIARPLEQGRRTDKQVDKRKIYRAADAFLTKRGITLQ